MNTTLHPTGYPPIVVESDAVYRETIDLGRRSVTINLFECVYSRTLTLAMAHNTEWEDELDNVIVLQADTLDELCALARAEADLLLPPGAGYPATKEYEARQSKLRGQVAHAALTALTECLAQRHRAALP
jgi:peptidyl-tRNA hydrolase